jgi:hypothetical protein
MKMKYNQLQLFMTLILALVLWTACDKVEQPIQIINVQDIPDNIADTLFFTDSVFVNQKQVLLEEFTGHKCVNCAEQSIEAHTMSEENDHRLIIYSIHAGFYAEVDETGNYTTDHTSPTGIEIFQDFQEPFNPTATINRIDYNGSPIIFPNLWETVFMEELGKENVADLMIRNSWYPNLSSVLIEISTTFSTQISGTYKMVVMIAEDHVTAPQKNNNASIGPTPDWLDYDHRNILRDAITPIYGSTFTPDGTITSGEVYQKTFFYAPDPAWETSNCHIIAYILHDETGAVIQVAELGIKTSN